MDIKRIITEIDTGRGRLDIDRIITEIDAEVARLQDARLALMAIDKEQFDPYAAPRPGRKRRRP